MHRVYASRGAIDSSVSCHGHFHIFMMKAIAERAEDEILISEILEVDRPDEICRRIIANANQ
jgi:hypothetical protein